MLTLFAYIRAAKVHTVRGTNVQKKKGWVPGGVTLSLKNLRNSKLL